MAGYPVALSQAEFIERVKHDPAWRNFAMDSRRIAPGDIFFALPGEHSDGHVYLEKAIASGARAVVLDSSFFISHEQSLLEAAGADEYRDESRSSACVFVPVENSLLCLQEAGAGVLSLSRAKRLAITGSNGKTSTKDLLAGVMSRAGTVHCDPGNYNSVLGLPVVMAAVSPDCDFVVFEAAMSEVGEMHRIAELIRPELALLTNIGAAHIGNIGSVEGIAREKFQIFSLMEENDVAVVPETDAVAVELLEKSPPACGIIRYGLTASHGYQLLETGPLGSRFMYEGVEYELPVSGTHHIHNAAGVITSAQALGLSPLQIQEGFNSFVLPLGRGNVVEGHTRLINDCYNANPDSMAASFAAAAELAEGRRLIFILADMKELGVHGRKAHGETLQRAVGYNPAVMAVFGGEFSAAAKVAKVGGNVCYFTDINELENWIDDYVKSGDVILLKGSRSMELERLIPRLPGLEAAWHKGVKSV